MTSSEAEAGSCPTCLAVVTRIGLLAVALVFTDQIAALTDWDSRDISATLELREQVRTVLSRVHEGFHAGRQPPGPEKA
jgi:hypothetical protein